MKAQIVIEGNIDPALVTRLLPNTLRDRCRVRWTGGITEFLTVAETLVVICPLPVAMVFDTDTPNREIIAERRESILEMVGLNAVVPYRLFAAIPQFEQIFLEARAALGLQVEPKTVWARGLDGPAEFRAAVLEAAAAAGRPGEWPAFVDALTEADLAALRSVSPVAELIQFLEQSLAAAQPRPAKAGAA